jgi:hypothetical protein
MAKSKRLLVKNEVKNKMITLFKNHIGKENGITSTSLFYYFHNVSALSVDVYKRIFMWGVIKRILHNLRLNNELFVVSEHNNFFVLSNKEERLKFHERLSGMKKGITRMQKNAKKWVDEKKYEEL